MKLSHILLLLSTLMLPFQGYAMEDIDDGRPNEHICPITLQVMRDPVVAADGHSYERTAIVKYFNTDNRLKSPLGLPLQNKNLFDNHALKTMIIEWRPGRQSEPSALDTRSSEEIVRRVKEEFKNNAALLNSAKDKHIVAFLGNTGAGKSTLINLLAGKKLVVSEDGEDYVLANPSDKAAMVIGTGGNSETFYPKSIDVDGLRFFDLPGFNDTDGSERNLVNAAFTRKILLDAASVRLVFVVGQDQFTADRSASVKQMFHALKQLFVVGQETSLVDDGVCVATKMTCNEKTETPDFLLKKTDAKNKAELNKQLTSWSKRNRLSRMFHPVRDGQNVGVRDEILKLIKETKPAKILGINVSVLYPPDTKGPLERMFLRVLEEAFERKVKTPLTTLSDYDREIAFHTSDGFWQTFDATVCEQEEAISLLKEFCINPYTKAFRNLEQGNEGKRQAHIKGLRQKRQTRVEDIEKKTERRAKEVIASLVPRKERDEFVSFDFAYHKDFHDQVCGSAHINQLAIDAVEQDVVRGCYADFISRHSHDQMLRWQEKYSGVGELTKRLALMEEELKKLKAPVVEGKELIQPPIKIAIPEIARGYEEIYERFLKGKLVYRPNEGSDEGKIELPIAALANPLESTFDLSKCGDTGQYLSIATGYRKVQTSANASKVEIWFTPRFLVDKEMPQLAKNHHMREIIGNWDAARAPIGIFWTWGGWNAEDHMKYCDYLTTESMGAVGSENLLKKYQKSGRCGTSGGWCRGGVLFHISFVN